MLFLAITPNSQIYKNFALISVFFGRYRTFCAVRAAHSTVLIVGKPFQNTTVAFFENNQFTYSFLNVD